MRKSPNPSIIITASSVPARTRSSLDRSICSHVGLMRGSVSPGNRPTRTPAMGFLSGTSEMAAAADAAVMASASVLLSPSYERTHSRICVSYAQPFGIMGRSGRSTSLPMRVSFSRTPPSRLR